MASHGNHAVSPLYWPIAKLHEAYRRRDLSPVEVLEEALTRIELFNPELNAFLGRVDLLAREQALAAEHAWRAGNAGSLCGVPVSIKDTFHINGEIATYGSLAYKDNRVNSDSGVVRRLRAAGAVFTGRTNTSEFAQSATAENRFFDDSHNPWDLSRTAGGSSGGAAVSVAAGLSNVAVGADGGGSIRIPASFTGLFGIKPTYGLCQDETGLSAMSDFISPGPFAWRVADARVMCSVLAEKNYKRKRVNKGLRIGWCPRPSNCPHSPGVVKTVESAVRWLDDLGHLVTEYPLDLLGWEDAFAPLVLDNERRERAHLLENCAAQLTGYERSSLEAANQISAAQVAEGHRAHKAYRQRIQLLFQDFDIIALPTTAVTAFSIKHRPSVIDGQDVHWLWGPFPATAPFNVAGNPAATIPCGFVDGLPVGLQLVGANLSEELLMNVAEDLEDALAIDQSPVIEKWTYGTVTTGKLKSCQN